MFLRFIHNFTSWIPKSAFAEKITTGLVVTMYDLQLTRHRYPYFKKQTNIFLVEKIGLDLNLIAKAS